MTQSHGFYTPLRYPGGKGKLADYVEKVLELNGLFGGTYVEPYAGGAAVAMELLIRGLVKRIHINDLNPAVHAFWSAVLTDAERLIRRIEKCNVDMDTWQWARTVQQEASPDTLDLAFSTFFLNRTNRSGILLGGVIGGKEQTGPWKIDARFNVEDLIWRIERIAERSESIRLHNEDAQTLVKRLAPKIAKKNLIYFDPPYFTKGQGLYMHHYNPSDHADVAKTVGNLPKNCNWMVSYDDHPVIRGLYSGYEELTYTLNYTAQERGRGTEVIFYSPGLVVPAPVKPMRVMPMNNLAFA
ncbi:DNA adenine methylase [Xanthomonas euvesicatoria]|uniref:DNA adenine methylase n=1 Tax=Xanthomonas euvesicatoria TaxID=456327 RepID=A0AAW3U0Z1_XANEU|nr:DNA adenine methylase [Xanthomonas euvesicatoria]MBB4722733.1 DNA adenine methylase [Xanthomonas euvesicatoria]MBB4869326.1 DNA adenine methylase [Xanthomonas euvesicatoria]